MIIGLGYKKQVGKDTTCAGLIKLLPDYKIVRISFADSLKEEVWEQMLKPLNLSIEMFEDPKWKPILRNVLKGWGEFKREWASEEYWIERALSKITDVNTHYVITDVRYPNEFNRLEEMGASLWNIVRPNNPADDGDTHSSEIALDDYADKFHHTLYNDLDIATLQYKAQALFFKNLHKIV